jgi:rSAM/selenodomain-associated transferase 1
MDVRLLVFCKAPLPGTVKTRLAAGIGAQNALDAYRAMVADVLAAADASGLATTLCYTPAGGQAAPDVQNAVRELCGPDRLLLPQTDGDLGARMAAALADALARADAAILVGSDLPLLTGALLAEAAARLTTCDAVLGPAEDGGYYAVGFTRQGFCPEIFTAMPWSTSRVAVLTRRRLAAAGRRVALLPVLPDCDTPEDLARLAAPPWRLRLAGTAFDRFLKRLPARGV